MPKITLVEGPVGAGKSTYSKSLAASESRVHIALDELFSALFSPDRPATDVIAWYIERKERLLAQIWKHSKALCAAGMSPILELGLIQRQSRAEFYALVDAAGIELEVVILDAPRHIRHQRVQHRNETRGPTFSMVVPDAVFEMASDMWQSPDEIECQNHCITFIPSEGSNVDA